MKTFIKKISSPLKILIISAFVIMGTHYGLAAVSPSWTDPGCAPTGCNVSAPLNVSGSAQIKSGGLIIANGGVNPGLIVASGNVGIGTASPGATLDVVNYARFIGPSTVGAPTSGRGVEITYDTTNDKGYVQAYNRGTAAYKALVVEGSSVLLNPNSGGNVGIGTASPAQKLDVNGQVKIQGGSPGLNKVLASDATGIASWQTLNYLCSQAGVTCGSVSSGVSQIIAGTNVTISSTGPNGTGAVTINSTGGCTTNCTGVSGSGTLNYIPKWTPNGTTLGNSTLYEDGSGNVGIGTASLSAGQKLKVNGHSHFDGWVESTQSGGFSSTGNLHLQSAPGSKTYLNPFSTDDVFVGSSGATNLYVTGNAYVTGNTQSSAFFYNSDQSLKKNIRSLQGSLSKILQLKGVSFDWKKDGKPSVGLIAQDVEKVYPELVNTDKQTGLKSVEYGNLVAPLIEAVKEQQKQIEELKAQIENLQK